tara:strand:- start:8 stop:331 length:324 start_codon:yes stop_codon:yes gene_type:complete
MKKEEELKQILELSDQSKTATEIGAIVGLTKNAVMGRIYRHKVKNGYTPAATSRYAHMRKYRKNPGSVSMGISNCTICAKPYDLVSKYQRFCGSCRKEVNSKTSWIL